MGLVLSNKRVMILGAGIYQFPLIKAVNDLGGHSLVVSPVGDYPGIAIAHQFVPIDIRNQEAVLQVALQNRIDAVVTSGSDVGVPTLGLINSTLNLHGPRFEACKTLTHKNSFRELMIRLKLPRPKHRELKWVKEGELSNFVDLSMPAFLKVLNSSGSRGVIRVQSAEEVKAFSQSFYLMYGVEKYLLEEELLGIEFGAQVVIDGEGQIFVMIHDDIVFEADGVFIPVAHIVPSEIQREVEQEVKRQLAVIVEFLELRSTILNCDFMYTDEGPVLIEIGVRCGGTTLPELLGIYLDRNPWHLILSLASGEGVGVLPHKSLMDCYFGGIFYSPKGGRYNAKFEVSQDVTLVSCALDSPATGWARRFENGTNRIGQFVMCGSRADVLAEGNKFMRL